MILREHSVEEARKLPFTCLACHGLDRGKAARQRYLEHKATKAGGLEESDSGLHPLPHQIESVRRWLDEVT